MGSYGGISPKPTHLLSNNHDLIMHLGKKRSKGAHGKSSTVHSYVDKQGRRRVTGTSALKATQPGARFLPAHGGSAAPPELVTTRSLLAACVRSKCVWRAAPPRSYPRSFGRAVARMAGKYLMPSAQAVPGSVADPRATLKFLKDVESDLCADAKMEEVVDYLYTNKHFKP